MPKRQRLIAIAWVACGLTLSAAQSEAELKSQLKATQEQLQKERATKETLQWSIVNSGNAAETAATLAKKVATANNAVHAAHVDISKQLADTKANIDTKIDTKTAAIRLESQRAAAAAEVAAKTTTRTQALLNNMRGQQQLVIAILGVLAAVVGWWTRRIHQNVLKIELSINSRMDALLKSTEMAALGQGATDERQRRNAEVAAAIRDRISPPQGPPPPMPVSTSTLRKEEVLAEARAARVPFLPKSKSKSKSIK